MNDEIMKAAEKCLSQIEGMAEDSQHFRPRLSVIDNAMRKVVAERDARLVEKETRMPKRIVRRRKTGWRMPPNTVYVGRPTKWGNHHTVINGNCRSAAALYKYWLLSKAGRPTREAARRELRGKNLACWCPLDQPCHADVLLEVANA